MGVYNGEQKASHCERAYGSDANISSYLWNETCNLISRDLHLKLINTN